MITVKTLNTKWIKTGKVKWEPGFWPDFTIEKGWVPLVDKLIRDCLAVGWNGELCQVKQKMGGLRFYINSAPTEVYDLISAAEKESFKTCEKCGKRSTTTVTPVKNIGYRTDNNLNPILDSKGKQQTYEYESYNISTQAIGKHGWVMALCKTCVKKAGFIVQEEWQQEVDKNVTVVKSK